MKDFKPCFEDMTLFMKLPVDGNKCSQGFLLQKSNCSPSHAPSRDVCVWDWSSDFLYNTAGAVIHITNYSCTFTDMVNHVSFFSSDDNFIALLVCAFISLLFPLAEPFVAWIH